MSKEEIEMLKKNADFELEFWRLTIAAIVIGFGLWFAVIALINIIGIYW